MIKFELESESSSIHLESHSQSQSLSRSSESSSNSELDSQLDSEVETFATSPVVLPDKGKMINKSSEKEKSYSETAKYSSSFHQDRDQVEDADEDDDEDDEEERKRLAKLEEKFAKLGARFRRAMNLYGLTQDVTLLLNQKFQLKSAKSNQNTGGRDDCLSYVKDVSRGAFLAGKEKNPAAQSGYRKGLRFFCKLISFCLVLLANLTAIYVLVSHLIWEFKVLGAKSDSYGELVKESASSKGWSVLKEFLENLRRHLSRIFAISLTLTWHLSCHNIEMIFVDCTKYYSMFYANYMRREEENFELMKADNQISKNDCLKILKEKRKQLLEIGDSFYRFSKRRVNWSIWLPWIHFCFNLCSIVLFPSSNKRRMSHPSTLIKSYTNHMHQNASTNTMSIFEQIIDNFDSFHLSIHTAFHPYSYNVTKPQLLDGLKSNKQLLKNLQQQPLVQKAPHHSTVTSVQSAFYCLLELLIYSIYFHGPRIICATCLAIILNIHHQCISFFNCQLLACIKRPKEKPLTSLDVINLVKHYDLIGRMHEKIEHTFKWSIVQWYGLMFISCLMHIFAFTESTSTYVVNQQRLHAMANAAAAAGGASGANLRPQQQQGADDSSFGLIQYNYTISGNWTQQSLAAGNIVIVGAGAGAGGLNKNNGNISDSHTSSNNYTSGSSSSFAIMFIRLASVFFVCYSPYLIYCEAFKIEAASNRAEQSVQKLVRRQDDPLAQAIEPSLFEPNYLSVGDYFHISKKSMSSLLGAIVTFSVMFIG